MYMSLIYFPGKTPDTGGKTPHTPRAPALPRKTLSGGGVDMEVDKVDGNVNILV